MGVSALESQAVCKTRQVLLRIHVVHLGVDPAITALISTEAQPSQTQKMKEPLIVSHLQIVIPPLSYTAYTVSACAFT